MFCAHDDFSRYLTLFVDLENFWKYLSIQSNIDAIDGWVNSGPPVTLRFKRSVAIADPVTILEEFLRCLLFIFSAYK